MIDQALTAAMWILTPIVLILLTSLAILMLRNYSALRRTCRQMLWSPDWHNHRCCVPRFTEHRAHRCRCGYLWEVL